MSIIEKTAILEVKAEIGKSQIMNKNYQVYFGFIFFSLYAQKALAAGDKSDSSGGLPQLDISTWPTQLFWLLITFFIGYIIISTLVVPSISTVLENRSDKILSDVQKAKNVNSIKNNNGVVTFSGKLSGGLISNNNNLEEKTKNNQNNLNRQNDKPVKSNKREEKPQKREKKKK